MKKYIITGKSRLTGNRDRLTPPISLQMATDLVTKENRRRARSRRGHHAYSQLRIESAEPMQLELCFT